jgi:hypothetical protein
MLPITALHIYYPISRLENNQTSHKTNEHPEDIILHQSLVKLIDTVAFFDSIKQEVL